MFLLIASGLAAALGVLALSGWHLGMPALVTVLPGAATMPYNSALGFVVCSVGLLGVVCQWPVFPRVAGSIVILIGIITISEEFFTVDLSIDQAIMPDTLSASPTTPGRMALASSTSFVLTGLSLLLMSARGRGRQRLISPRRLHVIGPAGTVVAVLGLVTLLLYTTGMMTPYGWGRAAQGMAIHSALGFVAIGAGIVGWAWRMHRAQRAESPPWAPLVAGAGIVTATLLLWQAAVVQTHREIEETIQLTAANIKSEILARMDARILALTRLAIRWENLGKPSQEEWTTDAEMIFGDFPGFQAITWVDPSFQHRWVVPLAGNEAVVGYNIANDPERRAVIEQARATRATVVSPVLDLRQDSRGFIVSIPIFLNEEFTGTINGEFQVATLFSTILRGITPDYAIAVFADSEELYQPSPGARHLAAIWGQEVTLDLLGEDWHVRVWPLPDTLARYNSSLPTWVLGSGFGAALLLSGMTALAQVARRQTRHLAISYRQLETESLKRRLTEVSLRESERRFRAIFNHSFQFTGLMQPNGTLLEVNQTALNFGGLSRKDIIGRTIWDSPWWRESPVAQERVRTAVAQAAAGQFVRYEEQVRGKGGTIATIDFSIKPFTDEQGKVLLLIPEGRDITERKQMEETIRALNTELEQRVLQRTAALTRANTDLRQLAYVLAHDLQEPVRMISTYVQLLARRYQGKLDADADTFIGYAVTGATRMHELLTDLLSYLQIEMRDPTKQETNCEKVLASVLSSLRHTIKASEAVVTLDPLPTVQINAAQLSLVFRNLLDNALKFHNSTPPHVHVSAKASNGDWIFAVRDNGIGIDPRYNERIFQMFERLHTQEEFPGTGMGLTLCKKIIERHGGRIWLESAPGKGAIFYFTIPRTLTNTGSDT